MQHFLQEIQYPNNPAQNVKYQYGAPNTGNQSGRLILQEDATGVQEFFYGNLGELTKNVRTFVMPNSNPLTFAMEFNYDSWNRITQMVYPDGDSVFYRYDKGGQLKSVTGSKETANGLETYIYVEDIQYDEYGSRSEILYGNGIKTTYTYEPLRRRLIHLQGVDLNTNEIIQNIVFNYDNADNIIGVQKSADRSVEGHSYNYQMNYDYDNLYRLTGANGYLQGLFSGNAYLNEYHLSYSPSGNILTKSVNAQILTPSGTQNVESYYQYSYESRPHTISNITGSSNIEFEWDGSGNMTKMYKPERELRRRMNWDEENRLKGVYDFEQRLSSFLYDATGERSLKLSGYYQNMLINANQSINYISLDQYTLYTSPYMVVTESEYTKHYYIESDRIASKIGGGMKNAIHDINKIVLGFDFTCENTFNKKTHEVDLMMLQDFIQLEVGVDVDLDIDVSFWLDRALDENRSESLLYYYHKDHLGSSTQITDRNANITHHIEYMPFGEPFVEQRKDWGTDYKFTGKELDEQTGLYYFGARYYNPDISIWLSIDPLSDKYPSLSPYNYCANNPIKYVDPDGMRIDDYIVGEDGILKEIIKTDKPHRLFVEFDSGTKVELFFNDPENDRKQLETYAVGEKLVTHVSNEDVNCIMSESGIKNKKMISRWYTAASQSENQMDFGVRYLGANPTKDNTGGFVVFGSKNKAYNLLDGGNFLWGYAMNKLGFSLSSAKFGADANEKFKDSMGDQKAIQDGFIYTNPTKEKSDNYKYKGIKK